MRGEPVSASATSLPDASPNVLLNKEKGSATLPPPRKVPGQSRLIEVILVDQVAGVSDQHKQGFEGFRSESAPFVNRKARERVEVSSDIHSVQPTYSFPLTAEHG